MDSRVKFGDSRLNGGQIIRLFAGQTRFTHFRAVFNCILQPTGSHSVALEWFGMNVRIKFGDSGSNPSWDIRAARFVMDDERTTADPDHGIRQKRGVLPKHNAIKRVLF